MHLQATQAAQQAKAAVQQNANLLQQKLAERQKLLSQLDQARMQEQLNTAMASLSQTVGQDVPTFDDVRAKIEAQYAKALGTAELSGQSVEARMLEIEQAGVNTEAQHAPGADAPARWACPPVTRGARPSFTASVPTSPGGRQPAGSRRWARVRYAPTRWELGPGRRRRRRGRRRPPRAPGRPSPARPEG